MGSDEHVIAARHPIMVDAVESSFIINGKAAVRHANGDVGGGAGAKLGRCWPANAPHISLGLYTILKLWELSEKVCGSCGSVRFNAVQRSPGGSKMQRGWRVNAPHVNRMKTITRANFEWSGP